MLNVTYLPECVSLRRTFKCVKPETFIKRAVSWYRNVDFHVVSVGAFQGICFPSLLQFEDYLTRTVKGALNSSSLGFEGFNSVYTFKVSEFCQVYIFATYVADSKEWHITIDFFR